MSNRKKSARIMGGIAAICGALMLVVYVMMGRNQFSPNLSSGVLAGAGVGLAFSVSALIICRREWFFCAYFAWLFTLLSYITTQLTLLANILYNVDGSSIPMELLTICLSGLAAIVLSLVTGAGIMRNTKEERV